MKLLSLRVSGYKNLGEETVFDFSDCPNYVALIGLNGSGKSNVLEAISLIFKAYYEKKPKTGWSYELVYEMPGTGTVKLTPNGYYVNDTLIVTQPKVRRGLPNQVIACYSGEELRMWKDVYEKPYLAFCSDIRKGKTDGQSLVYINKYSWEIALITLLCSEENSLAWILDLLDLKEVNNISVRLTFNIGQYKSYRTNPVIALIDELNPEKEKEVTVDLLSIKLAEAISGDAKPREKLVNLFRYLYVAHMPKENKIIEKIEVSFTGISTTSLSEGEKKMILIYFIQNILADENSLVLLDEPDSHVHIERKKQLKEILSSGNHTTVLTTHSPTLFNKMNENSVFMLTPSEDGQVKVLAADKTKHIAELTGGEFSMVDATLAASTTKDIILVEGPFDYRYVKKALEHFGFEQPEFEFVIFNCGGCHNVLPVLEQSILPTLKDGQLCLCVFDDDGDGRKAFNNICGLIDDKKLKNVDCLVYPKHEDFTGGGLDFLVEDYFPKAVYADKLLEAIDHASTFKNLESLPKAKKLIETRYSKFPPEAFKHFQVFFKEAIARKKTFRADGKAAPVTKFQATQQQQPNEVVVESTNYLTDVATNAALTAQLLIKLQEIKADYDEATGWDDQNKVLQNLFGFESLASFRVVKEMFFFLEELSHNVRGEMPREVTYTIESLVIHYFHYGWKGEEQTELGKMCCHIGFGIAYDAYIKIDDFDIALDGLAILKFCHGKGIRSKNAELEKEAIDQFDHVLSSLVRPESPELMDAHKFVSFMKNEWLKEVGNLTLPIYPPEVHKVVEANRKRIVAKREEEEAKRGRK